MILISTDSDLSGNHSGISRMCRTYYEEITRVKQILAAATNRFQGHFEDDDDTEDEDENSEDEDDDQDYFKMSVNERSTDRQ